jgi:hypothetical protein
VIGINIFDGLAGADGVEEDAPITVAVDCPEGDASRALMVGSFLGAAHFTCLVGEHRWTENTLPDGTCDTGVGSGLRCGRQWGHSGFCAVDGDAGFTLANIPIAITAAVAISLIPNTLATAVGMVGLVGWLAFGRTWVRGAS